jgi:hypothetical protein
MPHFQRHPRDESVEALKPQSLAAKEDKFRDVHQRANLWPQKYIKKYAWKATKNYTLNPENEW